MAHLEYRADIDALRGVAVGAVLLFHAFPASLPGGFLGVDVFFVISGFLVTTIIYRSFETKTFTLWGFYKRRIARLTPSLIVVLLATLALGWLFLLAEEFERVGFHVFRSSVYWMNFTLIDEISYFDVDAIYKPLLHLWSLAVEEHFYILWPLVFLVVGGRLKALMIALWAISVLSFAFNFVLYFQDENAAFLNSLARFWQLSVGGLLALYLLDRPALPKSLGIVGALLLVGTIIGFDKADTHPLKTLLPTLATAAIIAASLQARTWLGMRQIGLISYPVYLWHWVVISYVAIVTGGQLSTSLAWAAVAISLALGTFNYLLIEPLRYRAGIHKILIPVLLAIGVLGGLANEMDGLPQRSHLAYLNGIDKQLERGPSNDAACKDLVERVLSDTRMFAYCRSSITPADTRPVFALIGDSHAHALFDGFEKVAKEQGFATLLLANSSCPTFSRFMWGKDTAGKANCQTAIDQIFGILASVDRLDRILISTRGPVYLHGEVKGKHTKESIEQGFETVADADLTYKAMTEGLKLSLARLEILPLSHKFYLLENPELDYNPKASIPRPMMRPSDEYSMSRELFEMRMAPYRAAIVKGLDAETELLDPTDFFCGATRCTHFKGGFLYSDDDHTSILGAERLTRSLADQLFQR